MSVQPILSSSITGEIINEPVIDINRFGDIMIRDKETVASEKQALENKEKMIEYSEVVKQINSGAKILFITNNLEKLVQMLYLTKYKVYDASDKYTSVSIYFDTDQIKIVKNVQRKDFDTYRILSHKINYAFIKYSL